MSVELLVLRCNKQHHVVCMQAYGSSMSMENRWQLSFRDSDGKYHDHYFPVKPTRKQIRKTRNSHANRSTH